MSTTSHRRVDTNLEKMPGHWVLARMGKRVLRPGGVELTLGMLDALAIGARDRVVELAPGLGRTARLTLERGPERYVGIERDEAAAETVRRLLRGPHQTCRVGTAEATGLDAGEASVVYGEAMLTMQNTRTKAAIVAEAYRLLEPGGRYGIHELGLTPDDVSQERKDVVLRELSRTIRVNARPLTTPEWRAVLEDQGFEVVAERTTPMHLLEPRRLLADEGPAGVAKILFNVARHPAARKRVIGMRRTFRRHRDVLCATMLVARKPKPAEPS
ncbi:MAG: methyltransferase domain-containing protein [Myxococcota bacterium]